MSKIISKKAVYTTREGSKCLILVSIDDFNEDKGQGGFRAIVTDYAVIYGDEEAPAENPEDKAILISVLKVVSKLGTRAVFYPYETIDELFTQIGDSIVVNKSFSLQLETMQQKALLLITKQNPLYETVANDWEAYNS